MLFALINFLLYFGQIRLIVALVFFNFVQVGRRTLFLFMAEKPSELPKFIRRGLFVFVLLEEAPRLRYFSIESLIGRFMRMILVRDIGRVGNHR